MKTPTTKGAFSCSLFSAYFETDSTPPPRLKRETVGSHSQRPASVSVFERRSAFQDYTIPPSLETLDRGEGGGFGHYRPSVARMRDGGSFWPPPPLARSKHRTEAHQHHLRLTPPPLGARSECDTERGHLPPRNARWTQHQRRQRQAYNEREGVREGGIQGMLAFYLFSSY